MVLFRRCLVLTIAATANKKLNEANLKVGDEIWPLERYLLGENRIFARRFRAQPDDRGLQRQHFRAILAIFRRNKRVVDGEQDLAGLNHVAFLDADAGQNAAFQVLHDLQLA